MEGPRLKSPLAWIVFSTTREAGMLTSARCAVRLAKGVASSDQGNSLRVVHAHAAEGLANVEGRRDGVTVSIGALGVDVDEAHVGGGKRLLQVTGAGSKVCAAVVADVIALGHESCLGAPEDALIRLPRVGPTGAKAKNREAHLLERRVTGQEDQVGPREGFAILLLDGPQQAPCLVEIGVVGPAVERSKALLALPGEHDGLALGVQERRVGVGDQEPYHATTTASIDGAVGTSAVPRRTNKQTAVGAEVCRPPRLRLR